MIRQHRAVGRARIPFVLAGVLLLILTVSGCEPLEDTPSDGSSGAAQRHDLSDCPDLERGKHNPVDCVQGFQQKLRDNGYPNQKVTGFFGELTENNVRDFQRRHHIHPVSGIIGPKTRAALLGGGAPSADQPVREAEPSDYSRHSYCQDSACQFYLRRSTTSLYAQRLDRHPAVGSAVTSTLLAAACRFVRVLKSASVICTVIGVVGGAVADYVANELDKAAQQDACLRLSVRLLPTRPGWRFLTAAPDNSWRCLN